MNRAPKIQVQAFCISNQHPNRKFYFVISFQIFIPWTSKICLECLLCNNQSQARFSTTETTEKRIVVIQRAILFLSWADASRGKMRTRQTGWPYPADRETGLPHLPCKHDHDQIKMGLYGEADYPTEAGYLTSVGSPLHPCKHAL